MNKIKVCKARFTLVELLAVVALMALLMGLGVPAFARMIRGSRVDDTARNIKLALEQAQMRAASERRHVAVIFPNGSTGDAEGKVSEKLTPYRLGGYRLAYVRKESYKFVGWVEGSDWSNAPNGAILAKIGTGKFSTDNGDVTGCTKKVTDPLAGASACLKTVKDVRDVKTGDDESSDLYVGANTALVFTPYGGVESTSKLYLLVSEAVVDGDDIRYPTAGKAGNGRTSNYKVLKVNNLTGRVEFSE